MTITQQQIIALAVEAGMHIAPNGTVHASQSELETLVYAAVAKETEARIWLDKTTSTPVAWIDKHGEIFKELESVLPTDTPLYALQKGESPC